MITTLQFLYGFTYKNVQYGWNNKKLYRLPYCKDNRNYSLKEIPFYCFKSTIVYNIQKTKLTINRLKGLTCKIDVSIDVCVADQCPF